MNKKVHQRKPDIQSDIAIYKINGEFNENNAKELIVRVETHLPILRGMNLEGLLFSFEDINKIDQIALKLILDNFRLFYVQLKIMVGFCNYATSLYPILRKIINNTPLGLYKNVNIMALAIGSSNVHRNSSILIYAQDLAERQHIASSLISNEYFVIMALSKEDFNKKYKDKSRYNHTVTNSYFSNIHDDLIITFDERAFIYKFQGALNASIKNLINIEHFKYRLSSGYIVIVFDFTNIYNLNVAAATYLVSLEKIAKDYNALICCIGLMKNKMEQNAIPILEKSSLLLFDNIEQIYEDEEIIGILKTYIPHYNTKIPKKLLELSSSFSTTSVQVLDIYEISGFTKCSPKKANSKILYALNTQIYTHISFNGDYEGEFIFSFSKNNMNTIISHILVDDIKNSQEDCLDIMSEFVNSITGKLKSNLQKRNLCIQFSLPYATTNLDDIIYKDLDQEYILTEFKTDYSSFYVALCAPINI